MLIRPPGQNPSPFKRLEEHYSITSSLNQYKHIPRSGNALPSAAPCSICQPPSPFSVFVSTEHKMCCHQDFSLHRGAIKKGLARRISPFGHRRLVRVSLSLSLSLSLATPTGTPDTSIVSPSHTKWPPLPPTRSLWRNNRA